MTSAPKSASTVPAIAAAMKLPQSMTFNPSRIPVIDFLLATVFGSLQSRIRNNSRMPGVKHAATSSQARRVSIHRDRLSRNVASAIADEEDDERRDILGGDPAPQRYALQRAGMKVLVRHAEGFGPLAHHAFDPRTPRRAPWHRDRTPCSGRRPWSIARR